MCAYQFLAGRLPHEYASLTELALKQQQDAVRPLTDYRPEVPHALDLAVRVSLDPNPGARYPSALDMAKALEAGVQGETTEITRRLAIGDQDLDPTRALDATEATRALPSTQSGAARAPGAAHPAGARPRHSRRARSR